MRAAFVTAGINLWYTKGVDRVVKTLREHGWEGDIQAWKDEWPNSRFPRDCVYNIKAAVMEHAMKHGGYDILVWCDASVICTRNPAEFLATVEANGYWIGQSGYNCAQVCGDAMLQYFGVDRDWAEGVHDCASGIFGVDLRKEKPRQFLEQWIAAAKDGAFNGSRKHDGQSKDPRFLFGRQDQAAASIILAKLGLSLFPFIQHAGYKWDHQPHLTFKVEGM